VFDGDGYRFGFNKLGINKDTGTKYDKEGCDKEGINKDTGTKYNKEGYDKEGYNAKGQKRLW